MGKPGASGGGGRTGVYDFSSISRVQQAGRRFEDMLNFDAFTWPEYLHYYTEKAPPHLSSSAFESMCFVWFPVAV